MDMDGLKSIAEELQEQTRKNTKGLILFFVSVIILGVVGFCEVLYVAMLLPAFPDGLIQSVAIAGACATGASAVVLLVGKLHWFSKGSQSFVAWGFVAVETFILAMNVLLAVQLHDGHIADWLAWWAQMYPAAPLAAFVGWGLILFFDKDNEMRTTRRENKERQERKELDYENLVHHTTLAVKHESLQILTAKLRAKIASSQYQAGLDTVADQIANSVLGQMSGQHISSLLPPGSKIVDADTPSQLPQPVQPPPQPVHLPVQQPQQVMSSQEESTPPSQIPDLALKAIHDAYLAGLRTGQSQHPLAQPPLDTTASQPGTNGNTNGHQSNKSQA